MKSRSEELGDLPIYTSKLSEHKLSVVVFGIVDDSDRITKTLRSFGVHPLQITPSSLTQNPSVAYAKDSRSQGLWQAKQTTSKRISKLTNRF